MSRAYTTDGSKSGLRILNFRRRGSKKGRRFKLRSLEIHLFLDDILWGYSDDVMPREKMSEQMLNDDRYYEFYKGEFSRSEPFCRLCDFLDIDFDFHKLSDYFWANDEKFELAVFKSQKFKDVFMVFEMYHDKTDQNGMSAFGVYCKDEQFLEVSVMFEEISELSGLSGTPAQFPSRLVNAVINSKDGEHCLYCKNEYKIRYDMGL